MAELERDLREVGRLIAFPPEPNLVPGVVGRLTERPRHRRLVLALAVLAVALAAAFAVPPARTAILRFFHIGGETVERVNVLPPAPHRSPVAGLAGPMSLSHARTLAGFQPLLPRRHGRFYAADSILATYLPGRIVLSEFRGDLGLSKKLASPGTQIEPVTVNGADGLWIHGAEHVIIYFDSQGHDRSRVVRLAGNVLVWAHGSVTLRLEGPRSKAEALRIARSFG
jgi:hypothetical protein